VEFTVRDFRTEDFDTLWRIDQACFPPGISYSRLELATYMRRRGSFTLVTEPSTNSKPDPKSGDQPSGIVGFIVGEVGRKETGHIITIDVVATARRGGIGSKLLTAAEDRLRSADCRSVTLETAVDNQSALAFYKRHGYFLVQTIPRYYSNDMDAFVLEKALSSPSLT
jgi:[ribosomal protein S18]-alanine N-acetyltransferase